MKLAIILFILTLSSCAQSFNVTDEPPTKAMVSRGRIYDEGYIIAVNNTPIDKRR